MTSTENASSVHVPGDARRAGRELVLVRVFDPLSNLLVPPLVRLRAPPPAVVGANTAAGLLAAVAIARNELLAGALLLQVKTLLDNTDGRLARATGRVTLAGRYLDTVADLVVNAAVFAALAEVTGRPLLALVAFLCLTFVLSVDFEVTRLAHELEGVGELPPASSGGRGERVLARVYRIVFAPQDRLVRGFCDRRLGGIVRAAGTPEQERRAARAYYDSFSLGVLANLGLTTQLAALGGCLVLGVPELYLWLVCAAFLALIPLELRRGRAARLALAQ